MSVYNNKKKISEGNSRPSDIVFTCSIWIKSNLLQNTAVKNVLPVFYTLKFKKNHQRIDILVYNIKIYDWLNNQEIELRT